MSGAPVRALALVGGRAPYTDRWHDFAGEAAGALGIAEGLGWSVETSFEPADRLAAGLEDVDVLVAVAPAPVEPVPASKLEAADAALGAFLGRRAGVFALHLGVTAMLGLPRWNVLTGARWVAGVSGHPPLGPCVVDGAEDPRVPATSIELVDERYRDLALAGDRDVLVSWTADDGAVHPLVWAREAGPARLVADALGHDSRSLKSPGHRELIARCLTWLAP